MKLSELEVGVEYAIYNSFTYTKRNSIDINNVQKHNVWKAKLVSTDKYYWKDSRPSKEEADFSPAPKKEVKGVGLLFTITDDNGETFYYVTGTRTCRTCKVNYAKHNQVTTGWKVIR